MPVIPTRWKIITYNPIIPPNGQTQKFDRKFAPGFTFKDKDCSLHTKMDPNKRDKSASGSKSGHCAGQPKIIPIGLVLTWNNYHDLDLYHGFSVEIMYWENKWFLLQNHDKTLYLGKGNRSELRAETLC